MSAKNPKPEPRVAGVARRHVLALYATAEGGAILVNFLLHDRSLHSFSEAAFRGFVWHYAHGCPPGTRDLWPIAGAPFRVDSATWCAYVASREQVRDEGLADLRAAFEIV